MVCLYPWVDLHPDRMLHSVYRYRGLIGVKARELELERIRILLDCQDRYPVKGL